MFVPGRRNPRALFRASLRQSRQAARRFRGELEVLEARAVPTIFVAPTFATGADPAAEVTGDFAGNGDGTFQPATNLATSGNAVALRDVNGDGKLDLIEASSTPASTTTSVATISLGNGDGTFGAPVSFSLDNGQTGPSTVDPRSI